MPGEVKAVRHEVRHLPAAEEQCRRETSDEYGFQEISEKEHPEFHAAVLDEIPDDFRLTLRQIKGYPLGFSQSRCEEHEEGDRLHDDAPHGYPTAQGLPLPPYQFLEIHGPEYQDEADDSDAQGDLIGDHLRGRT